MESFRDEAFDARDLATPKRILVATDLDDADFLIPHAVAQARASNATVTLVHAILPGETVPLDASSYAYVDTARVEQEIHAVLGEMAAQFESQGVHCNTVAKHGFAPDVIHEEIRETRAARLIMASHGRGRLRQFLLGSVTHNLLGGVTIPVFVAGPHCIPSVAHATPRRILHPVAIDPRTRQAQHKISIDFSIALARAYGAELNLLHIPDHLSEKDVHPGLTLDWYENLASQVLPEGRLREPSIHIRVAFGNRVEEIRKSAAALHADWIVLGVDEGYASWPLAESTAYKVIASADCPVLTIRHEKTPRPATHAEEDKVLSVLG